MTLFCTDCVYHKEAVCQHKKAVVDDLYLVNGKKDQRLCKYTRNDELMCGVEANWFEPIPSEIPSNAGRILSAAEREYLDGPKMGGGV